MGFVESGNPNALRSAASEFIDQVVTNATTSARAVFLKLTGNKLASSEASSSEHLLRNVEMILVCPERGHEKLQFNIRRTLSINGLLSEDVTSVTPGYSAPVNRGSRKAFSSGLLIPFLIIVIALFIVQSGQVAGKRPRFEFFNSKEQPGFTSYPCSVASCPARCCRDLWTSGCLLWSHWLLPVS